MPKKLLLGATYNAEPHLAISQYQIDAPILAAAGGDYHRWTIADFTSRIWPDRRRQPFYYDGSKYIMTQKDTTWWSNFTQILDIAAANGIILQIELSDTWCLRDGSAEETRWWRDSCWSPFRNNHYGLGSGSGMPDTFITSDMSVMQYNSYYFAHTYQNSPNHPTMPSVSINAVVAQAQERFIQWVVTECAGYSVLFQVENESPGPVGFADFIADIVHATDTNALVTHMSVEGDLYGIDLSLDDADPRHAINSSKFQFAESSQNIKYILDPSNCAGQALLTLDGSFTALAAFRASTGKPINNTKIYNQNDCSSLGDDKTAYSRMGIFVMGGVAAAAQHPVAANGTDFGINTTSGVGMTQLALEMVSALRWMDNNCELGAMTPVAISSSRWAGRPSTGHAIDQVSAWAIEGSNHIALFMNGPITGLKFNTSGLGSTMTMRWKSCHDGDLSGSGNTATESVTSIINPFPSGEMAVLVMTRV